jgi:hypothetical protein
MHNLVWIFAQGKEWEAGFVWIGRASEVFCKNGQKERLSAPLDTFSEAL